MDDSIKLSAKHGVAPVMAVCYWCGQDTGEIMLLGAQADKVVAQYGHLPTKLVFNEEPCPDCTEKRKTMIFLSETSGGNTPANRTGRIAWLKEEALGHMGIKESVVREIRRARVVLVPQSIFSDLIDGIEPTE